MTPSRDDGVGSGRRDGFGLSVGQLRWWCLALSLAASPRVSAQDQRPAEDELFGDPSPGNATTDEVQAGGSGAGHGTGGSAPSSEKPAESSLAPNASLPEARDEHPEGGSASPSTTRGDAVLFGASVTSRFDTREEQADPLKVGGTLYQRSLATFSERAAFRETALSVPALLDVYLDARPNDRIRGMAVGRLRYDATFLASQFQSLAGVAGQQSNPSVALDQLWLKFDLARTVFVTFGRQKVRWGVSRLFVPTDFLNSQQRDPLLPFDFRLGANLLKIHVPIEKLGWNFYGYGLLDNGSPATTFGRLGGAVRAELVVGNTEIGLGGAWVGGRLPRYAVDVSSALGPLDVYAEAAFRDGRDFHLWRVRPEAAFDGTQPLAAAFETFQPQGIQVQVSGGASFSFNYTDKNTLTIGAEYFYNPVGTNDPRILPWLFFQNQYTPFQSGMHYAGAFVIAPGLPFDLDWVTLSLTNITNISDPSGIARLDAFFRVLTYLQLEAFVAVNYGVRGGEFRFGVDLPAFPLGNGATTSPLYIAAPVASAGFGLRVSI